jgi:ATP/maltotriose-dependent transcriptional regulator MalT
LPDPALALVFPIVGSGGSAQIAMPIPCDTSLANGSLAAQALCLRSLAKERTGAFEAAVVDARRALEFGRWRLEEKSTLLVFPLRHGAHLASVQGQHAEALELMREAVAIARRATDGAGEVYATNLMSYAQTCLAAGHLELASKHAVDCLRVLEATGVSGGPGAASLVALLVQLLERQAPGVELSAVRAAEHWLPPDHGLRARIESLVQLTSPGR